MRELTQTIIGENGNCWQTAVSCVLDVDPGELPDQATIERVIGREDDGRSKRAGSYNNPLQAYLREHHRLTLAQAWGPLVGSIEVTSMGGFHLAYGPTVRTATLGANHVIVAQRGRMVWDPHPSRAGLLRMQSYGVFVPWPDADWDFEIHRKQNPCVCPKCSPQ